MSKLTLSALMGVFLLSTGTAMAAEESAVNQGINQVCSSSELYNQYVCTGAGGLLAMVTLYDSLFKPLPAFLKPTVDGEPPTPTPASGTGSETGSLYESSDDSYFSDSDEDVTLEGGMQ